MKVHIPKNKRVVQTYAKSLHNSVDIAKFKEDLKAAKNIAFLSGAGISSESGIPTFRGPGGYWRRYSAASLATPEAFKENPSLVWEFYHHRREVAAKAQPNQVTLLDLCILQLDKTGIGLLCELSKSKEDEYFLLSHKQTKCVRNL